MVFREKAMKKFGYRKGALSEALEEAVTLWLIRETSTSTKITNPTFQIRGILSEIKETSVELQHEGTILFFQKKR